MKISLFLAFALLTGFIATSALDTSKRLEGIEKQQLAIIKKLNFTEEIIIHTINDVSLEAQQAKACAELNFEELNKIAAEMQSLRLLAIGNNTTLHEQGKKIDSIQSLQFLQSATQRPSVTSSAPPFKPSEKVDTGNVYEERIKAQREADSVRALEGIRDELQRRRIDSIIK